MAKQTNAYIARTIFAVATAMLLVGTYYYAAVAPSLVPTNHIDGTFQTASAMFRLQDGQIPGLNFFPYLGVGPLLFIFPLFKLFGGTVVASATAARYVILLTAMISSGTFVATFWKIRPGRALLIGGLSFMALIMSLALLKIPVSDWFYFAVEPGASLRPLRAALPYFVLLTYFFINSSVRIESKWWIRPLLYGVITGWAGLWSNDYAYITALAFIVLVVIDNWQIAKRLKSLAITIGATLVTFCALGSVVTGFRLLPLLKYNFVDVAGDQWWYFGPWSDQGRLWSWDSLPKILAQDNVFGLLLGLGLVAFWVLRKSKPAMYLAWVGGVLFGGGLVAAVGGHLDLFYFGAFHYWAYLVTILIGVKALSLLATRKPRIVKGKSARKTSIFNALVTPISLTAVAAFVLISAADNFSRIHTIEVTDPSVKYSSELGGFITSDWQNYIDYANANRDKSVVEEYWGVWSAALNKQAPFRVDSVIHSLGSEREVSASKFGNPDLIITSSEDAQWQGWSLSYNYWFYQHIIAGWHIAYQSPLTLVWQRNSGPASVALPSVACHVNPDNSLSFESVKSGLYQIKLDYEITNPGRSLVMLKNNIPKTGDDGLWLSMNLKAHEMTFPAYAPAGYTTTLPTKVIGTGVKGYRLSGCQANQLPAYATDVLAVHTPVDSAEFYASADGTFDPSGVSNSSALMFMPASAGNWYKFANGNHVQLPDGTKRLIKTHYVADGKLYVAMDGQPFKLPNGQFPDSLEVTK